VDPIVWSVPIIMAIVSLVILFSMPLMIIQQIVQHAEAIVNLVLQQDAHHAHQVSTKQLLRHLHAQLAVQIVKNVTI